MAELTRKDVILILGMGGANPGLAGVDLSELELEYADFHGANLTKANLSHADLRASRTGVQ
jgi:uncharacterized protein YjbI with pentapeptide repeats